MTRDACTSDKGLGDEAGKGAASGVGANTQGPSHTLRCGAAMQNFDSVDGHTGVA